MRTCWVLNHPAHVRMLAPFLQSSNSSDVLIVCDRTEVRALMETSLGILPTRQILWVPRGIGKGSLRISFKRLRMVQRFLKGVNTDGQGIVERLVTIGAPIECMATKRPWRRSFVQHRIYITDTEPNHIAHRLAERSATDIVIPTHWNQALDGGFVHRFKGRIHRLNALHGHVHLEPTRRPSKVSQPPRIMVRQLMGDGIHDSPELLTFPPDALDGIKVTSANENSYASNPWQLNKEASQHDGVVTQSVTFAAESVLLGIPTLLISKAERGFLDRLESEGYPLFRWSGDEATWPSTHAQFLAGLHLTDALESQPWPNAFEDLNTILDQAVNG